MRCCGFASFVCSLLVGALAADPAPAAVFVPEHDDEVLEVLSAQPYRDLGFARVDSHRHLRKGLARLMGEEDGTKVRILYGGSVKPANAQELMAVPEVNGALVGGASLQAADFIGIIKAYT